uniref:Phosphatidylinositol-3,4,5-trisphosphate 3-phosphatase n=1 Tax=Arcella intermedia TaxID=1963864 RepID=A0A6B2L637_9EUKA
MDLTYITKNIIAMGFPARGAETAIRNDIKDVVAFLRKKHPGHFLIVNVSERNYDYSPLLQNDEVVFVGWLDHYPPPMSLLVTVVEMMHEYLSKDPLNTIAIHCMAGRSRTGTSIASYLLYANEIKTPEEAINQFNLTRSAGPSLTLPSQIRAVYNYAKLLQLGRKTEGVGPITDLTLLQNPKRFNLKSILMTPVPLTGIQATGCRPLIEIYNEAGLTLPHGAKPLWVYTSSRKFKPTDHVIEIPVNFEIRGDTLIKFYHQSEGFTSVSSLLFRVQFHTSFIETSYIDFPLTQIDSPDSDLSVRLAPSQKILDEKFRLRLLLEEVGSAGALPDPFPAPAPEPFPVAPLGEEPSGGSALPAEALDPFAASLPVEGQVNLN